MNANEEIWVDAAGYEGRYQVSNHGRVKSLGIRVPAKGNTTRSRPGKILTPFKSTDGYLFVNLGNGQRVKKTAVHRIVLLSFVGEPAPGMQACHNDGDPANANLSNLRWDTAQANCADKHEHGTATIGSKSPRSVLTDAQVKEILSRPESSIKLAAIYGVASSTIRAVRNKQNWMHIHG